MPVDGIFDDGCKEEQISDEDFIAHNSDEENSNNTLDPSETELENLMEGEEATGNSTKSTISSFPLYMTVLIDLFLTLINFQKSVA